MEIGTEELAHMEMISAIVHQLTRNLTPEEIEKQGFADYYVDHTVGVYPVSASGVPWTAAYFQSKGDPITDLTEDMAADAAIRKVQLRQKNSCQDIKFVILYLLSQWLVTGKAGKTIFVVIIVYL